MYPVTILSVVVPSVFDQVAPILLGFALIVFASVLKTWLGLRLRDKDERLRS